MNRFFSTIKRCFAISYHSSPYLFVINVFFTLMLGIFSGINIYSMTMLVNGIQMAIIQGGGVQKPLFIFGLVNVGFILLNSIRYYSHQKLLLKVDYYIDYMFIEKCKQLELKDFEIEETYDLISRAKHLGKEKVIQTQFHVLQLIESMISIISVVTIILKFNNLIWMVILIVPIISTFTNMKLGKYSYQIERMNITNNRRVNYINYLLTNNIAIKEIISFNIGDYLLNKFKKSSREVLLANEKVINRYTFYNFVLEFFEVGIMLFLIVNAVLTSLKNKGLIGNILAYISSLDLIKSRFKATLINLSEIYKDKLYVDDFFEFLEKKDNKINSTIPIKETIKNITVENLNFSYNGHDKVLREINVEFKVNRPTVIVGANGAGKSSLIKILAGLYEEYEGNILINGINIKEYEIESYRRKIGIVFQDFNKYEMSLRENIAISNIDVIHSDNFIKSALDKVEMSSLLEIFKDGLDTQMGHWFGGEELSKGQWQRIAVARIWLRNADIIIFDEPTSALDPKMERKFFDLINEIGRNKILILVSHRVKDLLRYNPWFVIMKDGKVVLQGEKEDIKNEEEFKQLIR